jgi:GT2 family glycosyltransferase
MRLGAPSCRLSFVLVSWNARDYLVQCIESIFESVQSDDTEVIVVDNASTDGSVEAVKRLFPQVRLIASECNLGFAKANNVGIEQSTGEYILLVNTDVLIRPHCISRLLEYLDEHLSVGIAGPKILNPDMTLQQSFRPFPSVANTLCRALALDTLPVVSRNLPSGLRGKQTGPGCHADILSGCFWAVRRTALAQVGLLDEAFFIYAEDKDWCFRFWAAGWEVVYLPKAEAIHYGGASSSRQPVRFYVEMHRANLQFWRKHHGWLGEFTVRAIMLLHQITRMVAGSIAMYVLPARRESIHLTIQRCQSCARFLLRDGVRQRTNASLSL